MILARVQGHPSRDQNYLRAALSPLPTEVLLHSSDPPDPWSGYRACLSDLPECSHVLVVQDDALPCKNFVPALEQVAARWPSNPVCLFLGAAPASTAALARRATIRKPGTRYVPLGPTSFMPLVAVLWPRAKAQEFLRWASTSRKITRADDGNAGRWRNSTKQEVMVTVPSLVQHNDFIVSVKGGRQHRFGAESWRQAILLAEDGLQYDW